MDLISCCKHSCTGPRANTCSTCHLDASSTVVEVVNEKGSMGEVVGHSE